MRRRYPAGVLVHFGGALVGALFAVWVPTLAWDWDSPATAPSGDGGPGGLLLLAPLALGPAWSARDLVWPAVFGYLGDARWASIYAVAAGATLLWTSTWWGTGVPWDGGVAPAPPSRTGPRTAPSPTAPPPRTPTPGALAPPGGLWGVPK